MKTLLLFIALLASFQSKADSIKAKQEYRVGFALASPSLGISFQSVLSERHTVAVVVGSGVQAQINFTGKSSAGGYFLLGGGRDERVGLVRVGYGYVWNTHRLSYQLEASLNLPVSDRDLETLADLDKLLYLIPLGFGVHYRF